MDRICKQYMLFFKQETLKYTEDRDIEIMQISKFFSEFNLICEFWHVYTMKLLAISRIMVKGYSLRETYDTAKKHDPCRLFCYFLKLPEEMLCNCYYGFLHVKKQKQIESVEMLTFISFVNGLLITLKFIRTILRLTNFPAWLHL